MVVQSMRKFLILRGIAGFYVLYAYTLIATVPSALWQTLRLHLELALKNLSIPQFVSSVRLALPYLVNYSLVGAVGMTAIFIGSTILTEDISSSKCLSRRVHIFTGLR